MIFQFSHIVLKMLKLKGRHNKVQCILYKSIFNHNYKSTDTRIEYSRGQPHIKIPKAPTQIFQVFLHCFNEKKLISNLNSAGKINIILLTCYTFHRRRQE